MDLRRRSRELQLSELAQAQRLPSGRAHSDLIERPRIGARSDRRAHDDVVLLAVAVLEASCRHACDREAHRAIELDRRYAEQRSLLCVHRQAEIRALDAHRILDIARARGFFDDSLDLRGQPVELLQIGTDDADGDGRGDRRAVLELAHIDAGIRILLELAAQPIEHPRRLAGVVVAQFDEHIAITAVAFVAELVVIDLGIAVADVREIRVHLRHRLQFALHEAQRAIGLRHAAAVRRLDRDDEVRRIGFRE